MVTCGTPVAPVPMRKLTTLRSSMVRIVSPGSATNRAPEVELVLRKATLEPTVAILLVRTAALRRMWRKTPQ
eukprot:9185551-Alexandrium_andersonii.AAC.1